MHILRHVPDASSDRLRKVAHESKKSLQDGGIEILDEILRVRRVEEKYERNEVGMCMFLGLYHDGCVLTDKM